MGATLHANSQRLTRWWPSVWWTDCEGFHRNTMSSGVSGCDVPSEFAETDSQVALSLGSAWRRPR